MAYFKTKFNRHTWQLLFLGAMAIFLLMMIYQLRTIFNPVLLALVLAYIFNPVVELLQKLKLTRTVAVFITYLLISGVIVATILILLPLVWYQFSILYENAFVGDANNP